MTIEYVYLVQESHWADGDKTCLAVCKTRARAEEFQLARQTENSRDYWTAQNIVSIYEYRHSRTGGSMTPYKKLGYIVGDEFYVPPTHNNFLY